MTRYLFGIIAVALAFAAVAFRAPEKKSPFANNLYRFGGNPANQMQVQSPGNWSFISGGSQNCPTNTNVKACEIVTTTSPVGGKLPSGFSITAASSGSTYYVSGVSSGSIYNTTP